MRRLHLNVNCLDKWQSVGTVSNDSKLKIMWWEWSKLKGKVHYGLRYMHSDGFFVGLEMCLRCNYTSILSRNLSKLASYKSKNIILDWIADLSFAWTSIKGQENPVSESCSLAMNIQVMSQYPILQDAELVPNSVSYAGKCCGFAMNKWAQISYFDPATHYVLHCPYCQMGLTNMVCWINHNDIPRILRCPGTSIKG